MNIRHYEEVIISSGVTWVFNRDLKAVINLSKKIYLGWIKVFLGFCVNRNQTIRLRTFCEKYMIMALKQGAEFTQPSN